MSMNQLSANCHSAQFFVCSFSIRNLNFILFNLYTSFLSVSWIL